MEDAVGSEAGYQDLEPDSSPLRLAGAPCASLGRQKIVEFRCLHMRLHSRSYCSPDFLLSTTAGSFPGLHPPCYSRRSFLPYSTLLRSPSSLFPPPPLRRVTSRHVPSPLLFGALTTGPDRLPHSIPGPGPGPENT